VIKSGIIWDKKLFELLEKNRAGYLPVKKIYHLILLDGVLRLRQM